VQMLVAWRDDGFWTLLWRRVLWSLMMWPRGPMPPRGFVGQVSTLSPDTELAENRHVLIHLTKSHIIDAVQLWRLTFALTTSQLAIRPYRSGKSSAFSGRSSAASGAVTSRVQT